MSDISNDDWAGSIISDAMIPKVVRRPVVVYPCENGDLRPLAPSDAADVANIRKSAQTDMFFV